MEHDVLLQMTDICKEFPGVKALDHVSLTVRRGTVHALMGENGAGKSTLMKCLFGRTAARSLWKEKKLILKIQKKPWKMVWLWYIRS